VGGAAVEVVEVGQQVGLGLRTFAHERLEPLGVLVALARQTLALAHDISLVGMRFRDPAERLREVDLLAVQELEVARQLHRQPSFATRAAPTL
jgi:hypothetical protein